jgi:hypothetical protein
MEKVFQVKAYGTADPNSLLWPHIEGFQMGKIFYTFPLQNHSYFNNLGVYLYFRNTRTELSAPFGEIL